MISKNIYDRTTRNSVH